MSSILGVIGFAISAYGVWIGWRMADSLDHNSQSFWSYLLLTNLADIRKLDVIILQLWIPGSLLIFGLLLMGAASALESLKQIAKQSEQTTEMIRLLYLKTPLP